MKGSAPYGVALVGCGTVGSATAVLLTRDRKLVEQKTGVDLKLTYIVDRDFTRAKAAGVDPALFETSLDRALGDPEVKVVIELVGGTTIAREIVEKALARGKHVVTANKALLAHAGPGLMAIARKNGVALSFEASCAGGIPVVRTLYDGLLANRIDALYGIVNGTCNYILTAMTQKGQSYADALSGAQRHGLAEADPRLDVSGIDSAHKLTILASLAFARRVDLETIPVEGIDTLELTDVVFGQELGYVIKLLAVAQRTEQGLSLRVRPSFISRAHPLAWVSGPFNAVSLYGHAVGHTMYYGRGAGGPPTSSAILSDLVAIALGTAQTLFRELPIWPDRSDAAVLLPNDQAKSRFYARVMVEDEPGVFAKLAALLASHSISISSVLQKEPEPGESGSVPVVITTHTAKEGDMRRALREIDALPTVKGKSVCIGIIDEHEESIDT